MITLKVNTELHNVIGHYLKDMTYRGHRDPKLHNILYVPDTLISLDHVLTIHYFGGEVIDYIVKFKVEPQMLENSIPDSLSFGGARTWRDLEIVDGFISMKNRYNDYTYIFSDLQALINMPGVTVYDYNKYCVEIGKFSVNELFQNWTFFFKDWYQARDYLIGRTDVHRDILEDFQLVPLKDITNLNRFNILFETVEKYKKAARERRLSLVMNLCTRELKPAQINKIVEVLEEYNLRDLYINYGILGTGRPNYIVGSGDIVGMIDWIDGILVNIPDDDKFDIIIGSKAEIFKVKSKNAFIKGEI